MNFASWNVRGLNKRPHQKELINFITDNKISLIGCLETKVKSSKFSSVARSINKYWSWLDNLDYHYNGRICIGGDKSAWSVNLHSKSAQ